MSLDPLFVTAALSVGPAAGLVLWTSSRTRHTARAFRAARRLLLGALVLALLLASVATFRWSHATMGATAPNPSPTRPPLVGFLLLAALGALALVTATSRLRIRRRGALEERSKLGLVDQHAVPVPGSRDPAGSALVPPAVPACGRERSAAERRVRVEPV